MNRDQLYYRIAMARLHIVKKHQELARLRALHAKSPTASRLRRIRALLLDLPKLADQLDADEDVMDGKPPEERAANRLRRRAANNTNH
ncbi:hypothetical protein D3C84_890420 [compost metagenome]